MKRLATLIALVVVPATAALLAQQAPAFRAGVQTVPVYATVIDASGRLVPDLEREHFEVLDNGAPQPLTIFKSDVQPIKVVVMLDTSGSMTLHLKFLKQAAEQFVLRLLPDDRARIGSFSDKISHEPDVHRRSRRARPHSAQRNPVREPDPPLGCDRLQHDGSLARGRAARRPRLHGRRRHVQPADVDYDEVLARAPREEFMIYAIGLQSHIPGQPPTRPDRNLRRLAEQTGGGYFELKETTDLDPTFTRVADELHRQYVLGFSPTRPGRQSAQARRAHRRCPGMTARARRGTLHRGRARTGPDAAWQTRHASYALAWPRRSLVCVARRQPRNAAQQPPVFRAGTETVAIYADRARSLRRDQSRDLAQPDFKVFDEGQRQDLTHLHERGLQPITAVVLVDTSASMTPLLHLARAAAEQFVIRHAAGRSRACRQLQRSRRYQPGVHGRPRRAASRTARIFTIGNPTVLWDAVDQTMTALKPVGGRRVILLLTDGFDTQSRTRSEELLARAQAEELLVYAVQFRPRLRQPDIEMPLSQGLRAMLSNDLRRERFPTEALRRLAMQTGGGHFLLTERDDVNSTFTRVANELHQQYVLGFSLQKFDGKPHALDVLVNRPGMLVRARKSYLAPRPGM